MIFTPYNKKNYNSNYVPDRLDQVFLKSSYSNSHIDEPTYELKRLVNNYTVIPNEFIYLEDLRSGKLVNKPLQSFLGYNIQKLHINNVADKIHPEDKKTYIKLSKAYTKFLASLSFSIELEPYSIPLEINCRIMKKDGSYAQILRRITPMKVNKQNKVEVFLITCSDISFLENSSQIKWKISDEYKSSFEKFIQLDIENKEVKFSNRELDVLKLLAKGYTSNQIAEELFVSINTINTHRKSLLKKANVNKTAHLVSFALKHGYY